MICTYNYVGDREVLWAPDTLAPGDYVVGSSLGGPAEIHIIGDYVGPRGNGHNYAVAGTVPVLQMMEDLTGRKLHEKPVTFTRTPDGLHWVLKGHKTHRQGDIVMIKTRKGTSYPAILGECIQSSYGVHVYEPGLLGNSAPHLNALLRHRAKRVIEARRAAMHVIPGGLSATEAA